MLAFLGCGPPTDSKETEDPLQAALAHKDQCQTWRRSGELRRAEECFAEVLVFMEGVDEPRHVASLYNLRGLVLRELGELAAAEASFHSALRIALENGIRTSEASARNNLALLDRVRGDHYRAVARYTEVLEIWRELGRQREEAITRHNLGRALLELGQLEEAQDQLLAVAELRSHLEAGTWAKVLIDLGWVQQLSGEPAQAVASLEAAIAEHRRLGNQPGEVGALDRLGTVLWRQGEQERAEEYFRRALALAETVGTPLPIATVATNLGLLEVERGHHTEAKAKFKRALQLFERLEVQDGLSHALAGLARIERDRNDLPAARRYLEQALKHVESQRRSARSLGRRLQAIPVWQDYEEAYIDLLMELHTAEGSDEPLARAFEVSDLSRARSLYEMLVESRIDLRSGVDATLLQQEEEAQARLDTAEVQRQRLQAEKASEEVLATAERQVRDLRSSYRSARAAIRASHPSFAEIRDPEAVRLSEIQAQLDAGTILLSFALGEQRSWLFRVDRHSIRGFELPPRVHIETLASTLHAALVNSEHRRARYQVEDLTARLGTSLLEPLQGQLDAERLLIAVEGTLHYVPFGILPIPSMPSSEASLLGLGLLERYQVVQIPSAGAILAVQRRADARRIAQSQNQQSSPRLLAMVADPVLTSDDPRLPASKDSTLPARAETALHRRIDDLDRLPFARQEAEAVLEMVPPEQRLSLLGFDAAADIVSQSEIENFRLLHFATHASVDNQHPEVSGLVLSRFTPQGQPRDDMLRLHEIYDLRLSADLVVLSACSTALGELQRGEGMIGLSGGFFYAGASRLLVSLWDVDDHSTSLLMEHFYRALLQEGNSPAEALRRAQLQVRGTPGLEAPFHWAAFVLQGDWKKFQSPIQPFDSNGD